MDLKTIKEKLGLKLGEPFTFEQTLDLIEQGVLTEPKIFRLYFTNAKSSEATSLAGNYFYVVDASSSNVTFQVKFNRSDNDNIKCEKAFGFRRPFKRFWITSTAQPGEYADILIGTISPELLEIIDNRSSIIQVSVMEAIRDILQGPTAGTGFNQKTVGTLADKAIASNANRRGFIIQADAANADKIYIGFDNSVTNIKAMYVLTPEQPFGLTNYRGDVWVYGGAAGQKYFYGEW